MEAVMAPTIPPRISLIGFMGSGKSTVGPLLAQKIGYSFLDLDDLIEERCGRTITEIFSQEGEPKFRLLETEALYSLSHGKRLVIAAGGGAAVQAANRTFFRNDSFTVYLEVSFEEFKRRTGRDPARPLLKMPQKDLRELFETRLSYYKKLGRRVITDGRSPQQITGEILALLGRR
ncbi:Shikimate kinase [subsurface metagenome]